ncbi:Hypothetical predicted protein [Mytilus galloprovincialis]|uniref:Uncharacterized protein n=1 Tax=Mytilus galloprovincialis TaxID=29158 RepID=A0A8B6GDE5_MYTGA|nr:Hypothetical predicted protein [Mytilus galloprovincialis]
MSTFNSLMSSDEDPDIGDSSMHLFLESSQTSEVPEQGRSPSPAQIWRPHFESPVIANSPVTVSSGACGGPQDTPRSYTRQTSTPLLGRVQQENTTRISSSCIKVLYFITYEHVCTQLKHLRSYFDNQRTFLQEQFVKQNALVGECLSMLKTLEKRPENGKQLNKSKNEIHVPAYIKQSVRDGYKHNQTSNGLKWTTKNCSRCNSEENKAMTEAILIYVKGQHQTVEEGVIRCGIETYFNSVKQKEIMELTGKKEEHNRKMVLYGRKHRKLINRRRTLKERKIDPKEEERFMKALEIETMSSEDSDSEDDSIFVTRPLSWVSTEFKQLIQRLDRKYDRTLNAQGKRLKSKRTVGEPSDRPCPKKPKGLEWMFG